jgi:hypothetical protein
VVAACAFAGEVDVFEEVFVTDAVADVAFVEVGPEEAASWGSEERDDEDEAGEEDDGWAGREFRDGGTEDGAGCAGGGADEAGEEDHDAEAIGPLAGSGGGSDERGDHKDDADGLEADDDDDDEESGEGDFDGADGESERPSEGWVEGGEFKFLEAECGDGEDERGDDGHEFDVIDTEGGGLAEEEFVETALVAVGEFLDTSEEDDTEAEEDGEDEADGGVFFDTAAADDAEDDEGADDAGEESAEEEGEGLFTAGEEEGDADAWESGVCERIAEEALAAEQGEGAHHSADESEEGSAEEDVAEGVGPLHGRSGFGSGVMGVEGFGGVGEHGEASAVGALDIFLCKGGGDGPGGDEAEVKQDHVIEVIGDGLEVVMDGDDGAALGAEFLEEGEDGAFGGGVDACERFVHEVEASVLCEGAREEDALLLAAGELADLAVGEVSDADFIEAIEGGVAMVLGRAAQPADASVEPHGYDVQGTGGEIPVDAFALRDVTDPGAALVVRGAEDADPAGGWFDEAERGFEEGAFAGAVGADDGYEATFGEGEVDVPEDRLGVVSDGEIVDFEGGWGIGWRFGAGDRIWERSGLSDHWSDSTKVWTLWRTMPR